MCPNLPASELFLDSSRLVWANLTLIAAILRPIGLAPGEGNPTGGTVE
jgi:hypothetical protein